METGSMNRAELDRTLFVLALLAVLIVVAIIAGIVATGMGQDFFQAARPIDAYIARFTDKPVNPLGLRINLGLDNLFIVVYATYFVVLAVRFRPVMDTWMLAIALGAILLTALLDAVENHHILVMLHSAEQKLPVTIAETQLQMIASDVKFHCSYLSVFLFAFGFRQEGKLGRVIAWVFWLYVALGVVVFVTPVDAARPLALGRTVFFIVSFLLSATLFRRGVGSGK
jgi:hypothetical protein